MNVEKWLAKRADLFKVLEATQAGLVEKHGMCSMRMSPVSEEVHEAEMRVPGLGAFVVRVERRSA